MMQKEQIKNNELPCNLLLFFSCLLIELTSQSQTIQVIDRSDLHPIEKVIIRNLKNSQLAITDISGKAVLLGFNDSDTLVFMHLGYNSVSLAYTEVIKSGKVSLTEKIIQLDEVVLSANKFEEQRSDLPVRIDVIPARSIRFTMPQSSAELLSQAGNVFVQMSQLGGGSPVLRGSEANRVLLVVDGVRMNNAIYRTGHLQNVITIDPETIQRVEVVFGPGSVTYGSDAIGGVMHVYTQNPRLAATGKPLIYTSVSQRFASAASEYQGNINLGVGWEKLGILANFSCKSIGDLKEGSIHNPDYGDWGKCLYFAKRITNVDSMVKNPDPLIQRNSGYKQYDFLAKLLYQPDQAHRLGLNFQFSNSSDIPRYDRLQQYSKGRLKYAEWNYGPQLRSFLSAKSEWLDKTSVYDNFFITVAWQHTSEVRISRLFNNNNRTTQDESVDVLSVNADLLKKIGNKSALRYGLEGVFNRVDSRANSIDISTGISSNLVATRYPDKNARMSSFAVYATNNYELTDKLIFSQGLRLSSILLNAEYSDQMIQLMKFPFPGKISQNNTALNGNLGLVAKVPKGWRLTTIFSTGFRCPNLDDLSKLNESNSKDKTIIIPNPSLKPEYAYNIEGTVEKLFAEKFKISLTGFYTLIDNAIVTRPARYNGNDSILYDGVISQVQANTNASRAYITGCQGNFLFSVTSVLSVSGNLTYTYGQETGQNVPLDHIPPVFGRLSFRYTVPRFTGDVYLMFNGWKHINRYSPGGEDNESYAASINGSIVGAPSWYTVNMKAAYQANTYVKLQAGIENLFDHHYRTFASGISAPGRNLVVALRVSF